MKITFDYKRITLPKQMTEKTAATDLREIPRRPFGVYALVFILLLGMSAAILEIARVQTQLVGIWAEADDFLRDHSGMVSLAGHLIKDPRLLTIVNSAIILIWVLIIAGLWLLQRWAWLLLMIVTGITLTYSLYRYFAGNPDYASMIINMAVAFYLNDHSVQRAFARREQQAEV